MKIIAPLVPHLAEELWHLFGNENSIFDESLPEHNKSFLTIEEIKYVIQVNGKLRGEFTVDKSTERDDVLVLAKENQNAKKFLEGKSIVKEILVPNKLINFVVR